MQAKVITIARKVGFISKVRWRLNDERGKRSFQAKRRLRVKRCEDTRRDLKFNGRAR